MTVESLGRAGHGSLHVEMPGSTPVELENA